MTNLSVVVPSAVLVTLPFTFFLSAAMRRRSGAKSNLPTSIEALVSQAATAAVARARSRYELKLDYTHESIRHVETMLSYLHDVLTSDPRMVDANSMAFVLGAYVGETIRRNQPGSSWEDLGMGGNSYALRCGSDACYPMDWCMDRLTSGKGENVWTKYRVFMHQQVVEEEAPVRLKALSASAGSLSR